MRLRRSSPRRIHARTGIQAADHAQQALGRARDEPIRQQRATHEPGERQQAEASQLEPEQPVGLAEHLPARQGDHDRGLGSPAGVAGTRLEQEQARHTVEPAGRHAAVPGEQAPEPLVEDLASPAKGWSG
jgi:hypothetical protein